MSADWPCSAGLAPSDDVVASTYLSCVLVTPRRRHELSRLMIFCSHSRGFTFMRVNRDQESVAVSVGELVALAIGAVLNGSVELEAVIVLCAKVLHVFQDDTLAVSSGLAIQFHPRQLAVAEFGLHEVPSAGNLNRGFLHFQFAPLEAVGFENHGRERVALLFSGRWIERHDHPLAFLVRTPFFAQIAGEPVLGSGQAGAD